MATKRAPARARRFLPAQAAKRRVNLGTSNRVPGGASTDTSTDTSSVSFNEAQPPAPETPTYKPRQFDPSILDQQGESERTNLDLAHRLRVSGLNSSLDQQRRRLEAQRPGINLARDRGYQSTDSNAAARGVMRSGIRDEGRGRVFADYSARVSGLANSDDELTRNHQGALNREVADYNDRLLAVRANAASRRWAQFLQEMG